MCKHLQNLNAINVSLHTLKTHVLFCSNQLSVWYFFLATCRLLKTPSLVVNLSLSNSAVLDTSSAAPQLALGHVWRRLCDLCWLASFSKKKKKKSILFPEAVKKWEESCNNFRFLLLFHFSAYHSSISTDWRQSVGRQRPELPAWQRSRRGGLCGTWVRERQSRCCLSKSALYEFVMET